MVYTLAQQLDSVQTAIAAVEAYGQAITAHDGRSYTRANVKALYDREEQIQRKIAQETNRGRTVCEF